MCSQMFIGNSKERFFYHNTLLCLVRALQGQNITIDLRNDTYVCGLVISVDGWASITVTYNLCLFVEFECFIIR